MQPKVSILIPHFQTPKLTLLCLRLLRLRTQFKEFEVIVIDNGSTDGSGEALRSLKWIRLLRREVPEGERPARSHGLALNLGMMHARAPLILTMHTDTMILRPDWLDYLCSAMDQGGERCGIVGSWKMENERWLRKTGKWIEDRVRRFRGRRLRGERYVRSHCALYRREAIAVWPKMFDPSDIHTAGEELFRAAVRAGFVCKFLPAGEFCGYVRHLNHATMALNEQFGGQDRYMPRTRARALRRIQTFFEAIHADRILADQSLDY